MDTNTVELVQPDEITPPAAPELHAYTCCETCAAKLDRILTFVERLEPLAPMAEGYAAAMEAPGGFTGMLATLLGGGRRP